MPQKDVEGKPRKLSPLEELGRLRRERKRLAEEIDRIDKLLGDEPAS